MKRRPLGCTFTIRYHESAIFEIDVTPRQREQLCHPCPRGVGKSIENLPPPRPTTSQGSFKPGDAVTQTTRTVHAALKLDKRIDKSILNTYIKGHVNNAMNLDFGESVL